MIASVLLPTLERPEKLRKALDTCLATAGVAPIEIVLRVSDDDAPTLEVAKEYAAADPRVKPIVGPRGPGYFALHMLYNDCAREATGRWLIVYADDSWMTGEGWADELAAQPDEVAYLIPRTNWDQKHTLYPVCHRTVYDAVGFLSAMPSVDTWIARVLQRFPKRDLDKMCIECADHGIHRVGNEKLKYDIYVMNRYYWETLLTLSAYRITEVAAGRLPKAPISTAIWFNVEAHSPTRRLK